MIKGNQIPSRSCLFPLPQKIQFLIYSTTLKKCVILRHIVTKDGCEMLSLYLAGCYPGKLGQAELQSG